MKNKGFTLIEILSIIVVLGVIAILILPNISDDINAKKQKQYDDLIEMIENAGKVYLSSHKETNSITINVLIEEGYLTSNLKNPIDNTNIFGCVNLIINDQINEYVFNSECDLVTLIVDLDGGTTEEDFSGSYGVSTNLTLDEPSKPNYVFVGWTIVSGNSTINGNNIRIGDEDTTIKALWST